MAAAIHSGVISRLGDGPSFALAGGAIAISSGCSATFSGGTSPSDDSVTLTLAGHQSFPTGGQITVVGGPGGVAGDSGAALEGPTVFAIGPKGRSTAPA